ncbi:MAG TPA: glycosyltransferase family 4 protein [Elusimicrobiota bacterium]|nr:glycosyltransferase family 4 protein [Elusimicrobiota bacterium]
MRIDHRLALLFTINISVDDWHRQGLLDREKMIYEDLLDRGVYQTIYWFTYGTNDLQYQPLLRKEIIIIPMPALFATKIGMFIYSFLMPLLRAAYFRKCDVIKTNQMPGSWTAVMVSVLFRIPLLLRTGYTWSLTVKRNDYYARKLDLLAESTERLAYRHCHAAIVTTPSQRDYIAGIHAQSAPKIAVVPNYIDIHLFKPRPEIPKKMGNRIIYVGRLTREKNLVNLIAAFEGTPWGLDIYGIGKLRAGLTDMVNNTSCDVRFMYSIPNNQLAQVLCQYTVFILPSLYEGSPKSLLEAMSCGLACIGTDVAGINEVIRHQDTGWLVQPDTDSIRQGIKNLMEQEALRQSLGARARQFIVERYSLQYAGELEEAIHRRLLTAQATN